ncbi:hypothetical protein B0H11DRAFT_1996724 [Mycena galericulata]|nr:hypothetical protein B0H11DRAFT_1996724 [Mycena galericulata]
MGKCLPSVGTCPNPNGDKAATQVFAHKKKPCGCQVPQATSLDPDVTICEGPVPNGKLYCESAPHGESSDCKVQCDTPGWVLNPKTNACVRDVVFGCLGKEELINGREGVGCVCKANATEFDGEKCGVVPYNSQADMDAKIERPGRRICKADPNNPSKSKCFTDCRVPQFHLYGETRCEPGPP